MSLLKGLPGQMRAASNGVIEKGNHYKEYVKDKYISVTSKAHCMVIGAGRKYLCYMH